jgi:GntR family transcriptional regulator, transcriptional repressor for pyruvate dehydrogenase complex
MLAAQNALEADIEGLSFYLEMMAGALENPELFKQADIAFHRQLSVATQNPIYVAWIDVVLRALNQKRYDATRLHEVRVRILQCHRDIFEAVSAGDPEAARRAIEAHIVQFVNDERGRPIPLARVGTDVGGALGEGPRSVQ